jgi:sRNA-binding carbon storage regulator CsrA
MLSIRIRPGERFQISHQGVQAWVTVKRQGGHIQVVVDGPRQLKVIRESLVKATEEAVADAA